MDGRRREPLWPWTGRLRGVAHGREALLGIAVAALHVLGWGLFAIYAPRFPVIAGLGVVAYTLGLRHGFDVDHIAAIDNVTRKLLQERKDALGVGFFFSLGHALVVFGLAIPIALAARAVDPGAYGIAGAAIVGGFLYLIAAMNAVALRNSLSAYRRLRQMDAATADDLEAGFAVRGLMTRLLPARFFRLIGASWQMLFVGALFALGFETAAQVGLLSATVGAANNQLPLGAVIALPLLFAAGMVLVDTADGVFMRHAYWWALARPLRRAYYNTVLTLLSVVVAVVVGTIEILQLLNGAAGIRMPWLVNIDSEAFGYIIVATFLTVWIAAFVVWRFAGLENRPTITRRTAPIAHATGVYDVRTVLTDAEPTVCRRCGQPRGFIQSLEAHSGGVMT